MRRTVLVLIAVIGLPAAVGYLAFASGRAGGEAAPTYGVKLPPEYRDWKLITVSRELGKLDDIRAVLGNDKAVKASREGQTSFPDGSIVARIAWSYQPQEEFNRLAGGLQAFAAGSPKNGVQIMVKDSKRYASTGGWAFAQFDDGKPAAAAVHKACFSCHAAVKDRDFIFNRYAR